MAHVLILGRSGQVASELRAVLPLSGHEVSAFGRAEVDLTDVASVRRAILAEAPEIIINAAAYTAVDRAESDEPGARALNVTGPEAAARAAAEIGASFIQFSTDYVFDGTQGRPYLESDEPSPLGVYGRTKLEGEQAVAAANPRHLILRTAWVCSAGPGNFLRTMLRLAAERDEVGVVDDQLGRPTFARNLATATDQIVRAIQAPHPEHFGVFHMVSQGETTWCGFAQSIMNGVARRGGRACNVRAITTADYPTPARRPADSRLSSEKLAAVYGVRLPHWRDALEACLDEIYCSAREGASN